MTAPGYTAGSVGGGEAAVEATGQYAAPVVPPPAPRGLQVSDPVVVHTASCHDPDQHQRVTVAGRVIEVYPDGSALARMDDGSEFELCPWFDSACPNARSADQEEAA